MKIVDIITELVEDPSRDLCRIGVGNFDCEPIFVYRGKWSKVTFCVFDDAGDWDYLAWACCGQDVIYRGEDFDFEEPFPSGLWERFCEALSSARDVEVFG